MIAYTIRRLGWAVLTIAFVYTLTFLLTRAVPENPFLSEKVGSAQALQEKLAAYHLDKPLWDQYWITLGQLLDGSLQPYRNDSYTVHEITRSAFPISLTIGLCALIFSLLGGIFIGSIAALKQNTIYDYSVMFFAVIALSLPVFVVGSFLISFFIFDLKWFDIADYGGFEDIILPALALSAPHIATIARLIRGGLIEVLSQDYVQTARSKGFSEASVIVRHSLKAALLPIVTYIGPAAAFIVSGSVIIEKLFSIPGLGQWILDSALSSDWNMVLAMVVFVSILLALFNLVVDLIYAFLDPRIRLKN